MNWKIWLAYITGTVDQDLLLRNEYLVTENRILRQQINARVRLVYSRKCPSVPRSHCESASHSGA
jgi:hypothetical protein